MNSSPRATRVTFDASTMWVGLSDGRTLGIPLEWFPRLLEANEEQRQSFRIGRRGIHWEGLDEDISVEGLLVGVGDQSRLLPRVAE